MRKRSELKKGDSTKERPWLEPYKWKPGKSANPSGRPSKKVLVDEIRALTGNGVELVHAVMKIARGMKLEGYKYGPKYETQLEALKWLVEFVYGKAPFQMLDENASIGDVQRILYMELTKKKDDPGVFDVPSIELLEQGLEDQQPVQDPNQGEGDTEVQAK